MISYIKGILSEAADSFIVVEAAGVGYGINVPATVLSELPPQGTEIKIYTYYSVKEDSQSLFGFLYKEDREIFKNLISVNGIGPKGAVAILSVLRPDELRLAVMTGDVRTISRAQGIGKRTAERVILELKDKLSAPAALFDENGSVIQTGAMSAASAYSSGPAAEAIDALTVLGYSRAEAGRAVGAVGSTEDMTTEQILKAALKKINSRL